MRTNYKCSQSGKDYSERDAFKVRNSGTKGLGSGVEAGAGVR